MENNDFKIRIIDFYKDVDKPIINNIYKDNFGKNVLEFSTIHEIPILKKDKNIWKIKDKRKLLKDINIIQKNKIKIFKDSFNNLNINIKDIKENNHKLISDIESITNIKNKLIDDESYIKLKNLVNLGKPIKQKGGKKNNESIQIKIIDINNNEPIKLNINQLINSTDSNDFIEIFSN
jgi:hypothetical protein